MKKTKEQIEAQHTKFLKKHGYTGRKTKLPRPVYEKIDLSMLSNDIPTGVAAKPEPNKYSGKRNLLGIATMHKSNMVPVFSLEDAEAISKMRR